MLRLCILDGVVVVWFLVFGFGLILSCFVLAFVFLVLFCLIFRVLFHLVFVYFGSCCWFLFLILFSGAEQS